MRDAPRASKIVHFLASSLSRIAVHEIHRVNVGEFTAQILQSKRAQCLLPPIRVMAVRIIKQLLPPITYSQCYHSYVATPQPSPIHPQSTRYHNINVFIIKQASNINMFRVGFQR